MGRKIAFVLIHGTFARGAPWTQAGSVLVDRLSKYFPESLIVQFEWSGRNNFSERKIATKNLIEKCKNISGKGYKLVIVGHSHGGNIAIEALYERHGFREKILKLYTISTPFLHKKDVNLDDLYDIFESMYLPIQAFTFISTILTVGVSLGSYLFEYLYQKFGYIYDLALNISDQLSALLMIFFGILIAIISAVPSVVFCLAMTLPLGKIYREKSWEGCSDFGQWPKTQFLKMKKDGINYQRAQSYKPEIGNKIICCSTDLDEALLILKATNIPSAIRIIVTYLSFIIFSISLILFILISIFGGIFFPENYYLSIASEYIFFSLSSSFVAFIMCLSIMFVYEIMIKRSAFGGGVSLGQMLACHYYVQKFPPDNFKNVVHRRYPVKSFKWLKGLLRHSHLYGDANFVEDLLRDLEVKSLLYGKNKLDRSSSNLRRD